MQYRQAGTSISTWRRFVRCVLIVFFALDLFSAPLHAHGHDAGWPSADSQAAQVAADSLGDVPSFDQDAHTFSHSVLTVSSSKETQPLEAHYVVHWMTLFVLLLVAMPRREEIAPWAELEPSPYRSPHTWPPSGRAPPSLV